MNVTGFSHVTIDVANLARSLSFYLDVLCATLVHRGAHDAYLAWGAAWLCLQENPESATTPRGGVHHVAFHIAPADFDSAVARLRATATPIVREPVRRGLGWSVNFLDPDGTQLELHTSTLAERMTVWQ